MRHPRRHFQPRRNRTYHSSRQMMLREATKSAALNKVLELLDNLLASKVTKAERPTYPDYFPLQFEPYFESGNTKFGDMPSIRRFADNYRPKDAEIFTGRRSAF
jgi:hypothetical protein